MGTEKLIREKPSLLSSQPEERRKRRWLRERRGGPEGRGKRRKKVGPRAVGNISGGDFNGVGVLHAAQPIGIYGPSSLDGQSCWPPRINRGVGETPVRVWPTVEWGRRAWRPIVMSATIKVH